MHSSETLRSSVTFVIQTVICSFFADQNKKRPSVLFETGRNVKLSFGKEWIVIGRQLCNIALLPSNETPSLQNDRSILQIQNCVADRLSHHNKIFPFWVYEISWESLLLNKENSISILRHSYSGLQNSHVMIWPFLRRMNKYSLFELATIRNTSKVPTFSEIKI